jgi:hypothetical protein
MRIPILSIAFAIVLIGSIAISMMAHEELHKIIFDEYGINSTITYFSGWSINPETTPANNSPNCGESCQSDHNINEAVAYNLNPYFYMLGFGLFIIIIILEMKE